MAETTIDAESFERAAKAHKDVVGAEEMKPPATRLAEIEEMATLQFSQNDLEVILGSKLEGDEELLAYRRGHLKAEAEVRKSILKLAKSGSSPAQKQFLELVAARDGDVD
jgi:hypothetical protein